MIHERSVIMANFGHKKLNLYETNSKFLTKNSELRPIS